MDKRTRVMAAMNGEPVDKVPVGFWFHYLGDRGIGEACIKGHVDYYRYADVDFMKIMSDGFMIDPGVKINTAADWGKVRPMGAHSPYIEGQVERCKRLTEELGQECCLFYTMFAPFTMVRGLTSNDLVMAHLKENPKAMMHALQMVGEDHAILIERILKETGFDGGYFSFQGGERDRFSLEEYAELIEPSDRIALDHAYTLGENHFIHLCGWEGVKNHLESWDNYPGKVVNWAIYIDGMTLPEGRERYKRTVLGGFDNRKTGLLYNGTEQEIKAETKRIIDDFGTTQGLMIGADCTIPSDISLDHVRWVVEATREYQK